MTAAPGTLRIAIAGMGFCGMMTAVQLMRQATSPVELHLIHGSTAPGRGVAYNTHSRLHLLNVAAGRMSAFPDQPDHFLDWISVHGQYEGIQKDILAKAFLPRIEYGDYLEALWQDALQHKPAFVNIVFHPCRATALSETKEGVILTLDNGRELQAYAAVIATGNELPSNPPLRSPAVYGSARYFRNPWSQETTRHAANLSKVLIIGNGLTMVDTVISLLEEGFKGKVYSLSPHGYTMLPHRHAGVVYTRLKEELREPYEINALFRLFRSHIDRLRKVGLSAEPVVDSIRSISQEIWQKLPDEDKVRFIAHLRHLWGVARHRLPAQIYDLIQDLKSEGRLQILRGRLQDMREVGDTLEVEYMNFRSLNAEKLTVDRVINCTGPQADVSRSENALLRSMSGKGLLQPDSLRLGIRTDAGGALIHSDGTVSPSVYTLGSNLRGLLWESSAVPELRVQAQQLAARLLP